jgi:hypothetical protein
MSGQQEREEEDRRRGTRALLLLGREGFKKSKDPPRAREREKGEPKEGSRQTGEETRRRRGAALVLLYGSEEAGAPADHDRFPDDLLTATTFDRSLSHTHALSLSRALSGGGVDAARSGPGEEKSRERQMMPQGRAGREQQEQQEAKGGSEAFPFHDPSTPPPWMPVTKSQRFLIPPKLQRLSLSRRLLPNMY